MHRKSTHFKPIYLNVKPSIPLIDNDRVHSSLTQRNIAFFPCFTTQINRTSVGQSGNGTITSTLESEFLTCTHKNNKILDAWKDDIPMC